MVKGVIGLVFVVLCVSGCKRPIDDRLVGVWYDSANDYQIEFVARGGGRIVDSPDIIAGMPFRWSATDGVLTIYEVDEEGGEHEQYDYHYWYESDSKLRFKEMPFGNLGLVFSRVPKRTAWKQWPGTFIE